MSNIILFGAGVYVIGTPSESSELGNIGASLVEAKHRGLIDSVYIQSSSSSSKLAAQILNTEFGEVFCHSIDQSTNVDHMFVTEKNINGALIALPDHLHFEYIKKCGELGLHVLTVKPFVVTYEQGTSLINLFQDNGLFGFVEFHKRFDCANLLLRDKLRDQLISRIFVDYSQGYEVPSVKFSKWASSSNVFQYLGVHYVDLIFWLTGSTPTDLRVFSSGHKLKSIGLNVNDNVDVVIPWEGNGQSFNSIHLTSWAENHSSSVPSRQKIEVLTENGRFDSEQAHRGFTCHLDEGFKSINPYFSKCFKINGVNRFSGYGVENYLCFFRLLNDNLVRSEFSVDDRMCSFSDALVSVKVTQSVSEALLNV